jgi:hypothetical protein
MRAKTGSNFPHIVTSASPLAAWEGSFTRCMNSTSSVVSHRASAEGGLRRAETRFAGILLTTRWQCPLP